MRQGTATATASNRARDAQYQPQDVHLLQMLISAQTKPMACLSFYLACHAAASCPSQVSLVDDVFDLHSSQRCRSRLRCVATSLFDRFRECSHDDSIDVAVLSELHDCCGHPAWPSIMAGVCEVCSPVAEHTRQQVIGRWTATDSSTITGQHQKEEDVLPGICQGTAESLHEYRHLYGGRTPSDGPIIE